MELLLAQLRQIDESLPHLLPEIWLLLAIGWLMVADLVLGRRAPVVLPWLALAILGVNVALVMAQPARPGPALFMLQTDWPGMAQAKLLFSLAAALAIGLAGHQTAVFAAGPGRTGRGHGEFYALLLAVVWGAQVLVMANNLLMLYLALEIMSIGGYALAVFGFGRPAVEGGIKYVLFGVLASAVMLYGLSLLYGLTGSLEITGLINRLLTAPALPVQVALVLALAGLLFKIGGFPFHVWLPDVYEGAPVAVAAFFSIAPKAAAAAVLFRWVGALEPLPQAEVLAGVALASLGLGNLAALWQTGAKRLLAYSSVAHAGFVLVGVVAQTWPGTFYYLLAYTLANFLVFGVVAQVAPSGPAPLADFAGWGQARPWLGVVATVGVAALIGLPPTAGFTAKLLVFTSLWHRWQVGGQTVWAGLLLVGLGSTVVAVYYYLKIPFLMFFRPWPADRPRPEAPGWGIRLLLVGLAVAVVGLFLAAGAVIG
jgi:NADH-quinone oxidoreductase subunit N